MKLSKYKNKPCVIDGQKFRSKKEARRYQDLLLMQNTGEIWNLRREVEYELAPSVVIQGRTRPALRYYADFVYNTVRYEVVEDAKGVRTEGYRIKRHLMKSVHGIDILET